MDIVTTYDDLALHAWWLLGINVALWVASLILGKAWPVDFIWSSWPIAHVLHIIYTTPHATDSADAVAVAAVVAVWGLRLTYNFISRGGIGHEDWRYTDQRAQFGPKLYPVLSLVTVFLGQSGFMFAGKAPKPSGRGGERGGERGAGRGWGAGWGAGWGEGWGEGGALCSSTVP
jgi:steroid 5-alpha reductase family enzyme